MFACDDNSLKPYMLRSFSFCKNTRDIPEVSRVACTTGTYYLNRPHPKMHIIYCLSCTEGRLV